MPVLAACAFGVMAAILHVVSIAAGMHRIRRPEVEPSEAGTAKGVSIVRPVCGLENFSEETLSSAFRLEYPNYEILFCVAQPTDSCPAARAELDRTTSGSTGTTVDRKRTRQRQSQAQQYRQRMACRFPSLDRHGR